MGLNIVGFENPAARISKSTYISNDLRTTEIPKNLRTAEIPKNFRTLEILKDPSSRKIGRIWSGESSSSLLLVGAVLQDPGEGVKISGGQD